MNRDIVGELMRNDPLGPYVGEWRRLFLNALELGATQELRVDGDDDGTG